jgi:hypothetical protein
MNKQLILLDKRIALSRLSSIIRPNDLCYILSKDYSTYLKLNKHIPEGCAVLSLSGKFQRKINSLRKPYLDLFAKLSKKYNSIEWWGMNIASRNSASIPLQLNITYLFCAKEILEEANKSKFPCRLIFIAESQALLGLINKLGQNNNYDVKQPSKIIIKILSRVRLFILYIFRLLAFIILNCHNRILAFSVLNPLKINDFEEGTLVIRSWINEGSFNETGHYIDRNFGVLPEWLKSKGFKVIMLPMFFSLGKPLKDIYLMAKKQNIPFLIHHHYLRLIDYFKILYLGYKQISIPFNNITLESLDISGLFREIQLQEGFSRVVLSENLCYYLLKRIKKIGFHIDRFYYAFENNLPEKLFILGCKEFFPESEVIAYQHTVWFNDQLGMHITNDEARYHPIADKIIYHGPIYYEVLRKAGFPKNRLVAGPNLRFHSLHKDVPKLNKNIKRPNILLPLTFDCDLAYDQIHKMKIASNDFPELSIYIRRHPLFNWQYKELVQFLDDINMDNYQFADEGSIQDWLSNTDIVFSTGGTIVIVETVIMGVPLIKVEPDNNFFLDPLAWTDYPIKVVNSLDEIRNAINLLLGLEKEDRNKFQAIGEKVLSNYFTETNKNNMAVFTD